MAVQEAAPDRNQKQKYPDRCGTSRRHVAIEQQQIEFDDTISLRGVGVKGWLWDKVSRVLFMRERQIEQRWPLYTMQRLHPSDLKIENCRLRS